MLPESISFSWFRIELSHNLSQHHHGILIFCSRPSPAHHPVLHSHATFMAAAPHYPTLFNSKKKNRVCFLCVFSQNLFSFIQKSFKLWIFGSVFIFFYFDIVTTVCNFHQISHCLRSFFIPWPRVRQLQHQKYEPRDLAPAARGSCDLADAPRIYMGFWYP